jgi:hypothetical protein
MTLTKTLRIKEEYLQFEDLRAMDYCEKRWQQEGRPATKWEMVNFIERMLRELRQNGIGYPKVLLLRKKEIQRQQFKVEQPGETPAGSCSCIGGYQANGTVCPCPKGEPHREKLRKWGMQI